MSTPVDQQQRKKRSLSPSSNEAGDDGTPQQGLMSRISNVLFSHSVKRARTTHYDDAKSSVGGDARSPLPGLRFATDDSPRFDTLFPSPMAAMPASAVTVAPADNSATSSVRFAVGSNDASSTRPFQKRTVAPTFARTSTPFRSSKATPFVPRSKPTRSPAADSQSSKSNSVESAKLTPVTADATSYRSNGLPLKRRPFVVSRFVGTPSRFSSSEFSKFYKPRSLLLTDRQRKQNFELAERILSSHSDLFSSTKQDADDGELFGVVQVVKGAEKRVFGTGQTGSRLPSASLVFRNSESTQPLNAENHKSAPQKRPRIDAGNTPATDKTKKNSNNNLHVQFSSDAKPTEERGAKQSIIPRHSTSLSPFRHPKPVTSKTYVDFASNANSRDDNGHLTYEPLSIFGNKVEPFLSSKGVGEIDEQEGDGGIDATWVAVWDMSLLLPKGRDKVDFSKRLQCKATSCHTSHVVSMGSEISNSGDSSAPLIASTPDKHTGSQKRPSFVLNNPAPRSTDQKVSTLLETSGTTGIWGVDMFPKPGEWKCSTCSVRNNKDATICAACESAKLESDGNPAPASTPAPTSDVITTTSSGWGDLFKPKPDEWRCEVCRVMNQKNAASCESCDAKRVSDVDNKTGEKSEDAIASTKQFPLANAGDTSKTVFSFGTSKNDTDQETKTGTSKLSIGQNSLAIGGHEKTTVGSKFSLGFNNANTGQEKKADTPKFSFGTPPATLRTTAITEESKPPKNNSESTERDDTAKPVAGRFKFGEVSAASAAVGGDAKPSPMSGNRFSFGSANGTTSGKPRDFLFGGSGDRTAVTATQPKVSDVSNDSRNEGDEVRLQKKKRIHDDEGEGADTQAYSVDGNNNSSSNLTSTSFVFGTPAPVSFDSSGPPVGSSFGFNSNSAAPVPPPLDASSFQFGAPKSNSARGSVGDSFLFNKSNDHDGRGDSAMNDESDGTESSKPSTAPTFSFGSAPSTQASAIGVTPFKFGQSTVPPPSKPTPLFTFGSAPAPGAEAHSASGGLTFSHAPNQTKQPQVLTTDSSGFGASTTTPIPSLPGHAFSFGAAAAPTAGPLFAFGAAAPQQPSLSMPHSFAFGSSGSTSTVPPIAGGLSLGIGSMAVPGPSTGNPGFFFGGGQYTVAPPGPGFGSTGGFGTTPALFMGGTSAGGFSIGTGGSKLGTSGVAKGRRIVKARRPPAPK